MLEAELYPPLKKWFEAQDYQVRGEVKHCDLVAEKADELVIVELKIKPSLKLLYQASERLSVTDQVFVGLPGSSHRSRALTPFIRLLKLLGIGLILIHQSSLGDRIEVRCQPKVVKPRKSSRKMRLLKTEFNGRSSTDTPGGSAARPLITAYREEAILIFAALETLGVASPKALKSLGCSIKTGSILLANHYNWFERIERGRYQCSPDAALEIANRFPETYALAHQRVSEISVAEMRATDNNEEKHP